MATSRRQSTATAAHCAADASEPLLPTTVGGVLRAAAARAPDETALVDGVSEPSARRRWTFAQVLGESERAAAALRERFDPGERIAVCAPNSPEWWFLQFGAALAGLVLVPINPALTAAEAADILRRSRAAGGFFVEEHRGRSLTRWLDVERPRLAELREVCWMVRWADFVRSGSGGSALPEVKPGDPALIVQTSGTTGSPKGAVLTHLGVTNSSRFCGRRLHAEPGDVWVDPMPLFHVAGSVVLTLGSVQCLAAHVLMRSYTPRLHLALLAAERGTVLAGVPAMLGAALGDHAVGTLDLTSLRSALIGGSPVAPELVRRLEARFGVPVAIIYAQTETSACISQVALRDGRSDRETTVGRPMPHNEVRIVDVRTGATLQTDETGEVCVRSPLLMTGYFEDASATAAAIDADGWLHTGDLGSISASGFCRVSGRSDDLIIRGGENIDPTEIERVLCGHAGVADAAVVGFPDRRWGEQIAAFVRAAEGATIDPGELAAHCRRRLARFKVPRRWIVVDELPRTPTGKVQKYVLRRHLAAR